jgi:hypothetical protein
LIRFIFALLLLLIAVGAGPGPAGASMPAFGASESYRYVASDPEFAFGAVRSGSGWELLLELAGRVTARAKSADAASPWAARGRAGEEPGAHDLLPLRTRRFIRTREIDLRRADSVCRYHEPCQANPPPLPQSPELIS